ncbi:transcriptional regulator [Archaeoglobales archaeon]|nr:MAG: transcriptional regulator [Archaeoglobales archaeon]
MVVFLPNKKRGERMSTIISKLKSIRQLKNLSQQQLADLVGVSRESIAAYENGRVRPSLPVLLKLAKVLGVKPEDLFDLEDSTPAASR